LLHLLLRTRFPPYYKANWHFWDKKEKILIQNTGKSVWISECYYFLYHIFISEPEPWNPWPEPKLHHVAGSGSIKQMWLQLRLCGSATLHATVHVLRLAPSEPRGHHSQPQGMWITQPSSWLRVWHPQSRVGTIHKTTGHLNHATSHVLRVWHPQSRVGTIHKTTGHLNHATSHVLRVWHPQNHVGTIHNHRACESRNLSHSERSNHIATWAPSTTTGHLNQATALKYEGQVRKGVKMK
jgi:hypothetical protein